MEECVTLAKSTAALVADAFHVPVFLYEEAAATDERRSLADIRRGGVNGVALRMKQAAWRPDFGPDRPHPTAGATAIGARPILIAYNVNLASNRLGVAKRIASVIRASSGGLPDVKALGMQLDHGVVQVSMNLTNYKETSMVTVFDAIDARSRGGWRACAGERDRRARARRCAASGSCAQIEVTCGRSGQGVGDAPENENEERKTNMT